MKNISLAEKQTSPFSLAFKASTRKIRTASQAQAAFSIYHFSGSCLRRGAYIVGHTLHFAFKDFMFLAGNAGTSVWYGSERVNSIGISGFSAELVRRKVCVGPVCRTRLRWSRSSVSLMFSVAHL